MIAADATAQSSLVSVTMSMMVLTPAPGSPTGSPIAPSNSTSDEALERLPSLSLRRWKRKPLPLPSLKILGTRKQDSPSPACASTRKASDIGADMNHLWPVMRKKPLPAFSAFVVLARTSVPPCFSVMPMPSVRPAFCTGGFWLWSYLRLVMRGAHSRNIFGLAISAASEALVMVIGHRCPASSSAVR